IPFMTQTASTPVPTAAGFEWRSLAVNLLLLGVTVVICLALLEFAVRRLFPFLDSSRQIEFRLMTNGMALGPASATVWQATPKGDYALLIRFNADGFRDSKNLREANDADWFALGDSFTLGGAWRRTSASPTSWNRDSRATAAKPGSSISP